MEKVNMEIFQIITRIQYSYDQPNTSIVSKMMQKKLKIYIKILVYFGMHSPVIICKA